MSAFQGLGGETRFEGRTFSVRVECFRHSDGEEVTREVVRRQDAVAVVAHDGEHVYLVRQPREAIGRADIAELPAGKLDVEGEGPLRAARRELAEEIGKAAEHWEHLTTYFASSGYTDEAVHVFLATGLSDADAQADEHERIEVDRVALSELDAAIASSQDAKTIIGLQMLRARRRG